MESLRIKVEELDRWKNMEKIVLSGLPGIKAYDIRLHTFLTNECQDLACRFEEKFKQSLSGMMNVYDEPVQDIQNISNGLRSIFKMNIQFHFLYFRRSKMQMNLSRRMWNRNNSLKEDIQEFHVKPTKEFRLHVLIHKKRKLRF